MYLSFRMIKNFFIREEFSFGLLFHHWYRRIQFISRYRIQRQRCCIVNFSIKKGKKEKSHKPYNCDLCTNKNHGANIKLQRKINEISETDDFSTSMSPSPVIKFVRTVINNFPILEITRVHVVIHYTVRKRKFTWR